jgi:hypothetical protein
VQLAKDRNFLRLLVTIDAGIAAAVAALVFHDQFAWPIVVLVCLLVGAGSPFAYRLLALALCWWKPGLRKYLALPELADPEPPTDEHENGAP